MKPAIKPSIAKDTEMNLQELMLETDLSFRELAENREATKAVVKQIDDTIDQALSEKNTPLLLSLIPYIESGAGQLAFKYIGKTHRILRILHIIELEDKFHKKLFSADCLSKAALWEKYMLSLFALRRLLFQLSESSIAEACGYLLQNTLSPFAVYVILQGDLILPDDALYDRIITVYSDKWSNEDIQIFRSLIQTGRGLYHE